MYHVYWVAVTCCYSQFVHYPLSWVDGSTACAEWRSEPKEQFIWSKSLKQAEISNVRCRCLESETRRPNHSATTQSPKLLPWRKTATSTLAFFFYLYQRLKTQQKWAGWKSMRVARSRFFPADVTRSQGLPPQVEKSTCPGLFSGIFPTQTWPH